MWVKSVCQRQVQQMIGRLPLVAAWIVYRDQQKRYSVSDYRSDSPGFDQAILLYLESEAWLGNEMPLMKLTQVVFHRQYANSGYTGTAQYAIGASLDERLDSSIFAYVLPMVDHNSDKTCQNPSPTSEKENYHEYWLLWAYTALSAEEQQMIEQQAQLLNDYLRVYQECVRQREEIQLLEQVVRRGEHQLRNPLALIALYAENLSLGLPPGSFQEQAMIIRDTVKELSANLTNLLHCGNQAKLRIAVHDLREIFIESIKFLQPKLDKKQIQIRYPVSSLSLALDGWQMKQVFENILSNAVDFSPVGGIISCNWQGFRQEVLVEIYDQGSGLSQEDLKEAFTPFYSRRPGGTGLGLTIVKKIILDHHGSIWIQNLSVGGAHVAFTLPLYTNLRK